MGSIRTPSTSADDDTNCYIYHVDLYGKLFELVEHKKMWANEMRMRITHMCSKLTLTGSNMGNMCNPPLVKFSAAQHKNSQ